VYIVRVKVTGAIKLKSQRFCSILVGISLSLTFPFWIFAPTR
jgi:hypothetical protein